MLVDGEELEALGVGAEGEGKPGVLAVEEDIGHGVAPGDAFLGDIQPELLTRRLLDLLQRRPEFDQRVVEVEGYYFYHLRPCACPGTNPDEKNGAA